VLVGYPTLARKISRPHSYFGAGHWGADYSSCIRIVRRESYFAIGSTSS